MANASTRKRKEQRERAFFKKCAKQQGLKYWESLSEEILSDLGDKPHPKIDSEEHDLCTYVMWLCYNGYTEKAREVVDGNTSSN